MSKPLLLSAPIQLSAAEGSAADAVPSKFSGVAYSGERIPDGWNAVIDLSTTKAEPGMPLMYAHDQMADIGTIDSVIINGDIRVSGKLFSDIDAHAKLLAEKAKRGARYQMSVGLFGYSEKWIPAGQSETVNGKQFDGPITILAGGTVREVSIVPLGADPRTQASFFKAGEPQPTPEPDMTAEALKAANDKVAALEAKIAAMEKAQADAAAAKFAADKAARETAVKALFSDTGREYKPEAAAPYLDPLAMPEALFASVSADLRAAAKQKLPGALFSHVATGDGDHKPALSLVANMRAMHGIKS